MAHTHKPNEATRAAMEDSGVMASRGFHNTVRKMGQRRPKFLLAMLEETLAALKERDLESAEALLQDCIAIQEANVGATE